MDRYRPVRWLDGSAPFSSCLVYRVMTEVVLRGRFNIAESIYGLESAGYIRGQTPARTIPECTWVSCMVNVRTMLIHSPPRLTMRMSDRNSMLSNSSNRYECIGRELLQRANGLLYRYISRRYQA